ncbi:hypothetical protein ACHAPT_009261 [Fusarium lateritium]
MAQTTGSPSIDGFLQDPRFHRSFSFPASPEDGQTTLQVKYADFGYRNEANPQEENVLLFFPPLMGSRLLHITKDDLAKRHKIRFISIDRPGIGGTSEVELEKRVSISREINLALLQHLGIQQVSLACHSGGTIYALDMALHHPEILHQDRPYLAIAAPWILPSRSHVLSMTLTQAIPNSVMAHTDKVISFVNSTFVPVFSTSTGVSQALVSLTKSNHTGATSDDPDAKFEKELAPKQFKLIHSESIRGMSHESLLLMQKVKEVNGWGDWKDYDDLLPKLVEALKRANRTLSIEVFFAEEDFLVGAAATEGPEWFSKCWKAEEARDVVSYSSSVITGANHETAWNIDLGVPGRVFERLSSLNS